MPACLADSKKNSSKIKKKLKFIKSKAPRSLPTLSQESSQTEKETC